MRQSRKQREIEARRAADPIAQIVGRNDIDYSNPDELPTAPRSVNQSQALPTPPIESSKTPEVECCSDWKPQTDVVSSYIAVASIRGNTRYEGKRFIYCPWCGTKR